MHQPQLFGRDAKWRLGRRTLHVVPRNDMTGYVIRTRWSQQLGMQLDHVFASHAEATRYVDRIALCGFITPIHWKKIFRPKWTPKCQTIRSIPS